MGISIVGAFLYLRYTPPLYQSITVLQISNNNNADKVLEIENLREENTIAQTIELLRSQEFLKRVFSKLPIDIQYFNEGTFLSNEMYKSSPFEVKVKINNGAIYDKKIYIDFENPTTYHLKINSDDLEFENLSVGKWENINGIDVKVTITNYKGIEELHKSLNHESFFFILKNPTTLLNEHISKLEIKLQNPEANTIEISYVDNNALKTSEVVNTIAEEFRKYDVERMKESAESILAFIEEQLEAVYKKLSETERQIHSFKKENKISPNSDLNLSAFPIYTSKIHEFDEEIMNIEFELVTLNRIKSEVAENKNIDVYELIALLSGTKSEGYISNILESIQQKNDQKDMLLNDVTNNNHKIKIVDKQIENLRKTMIDFIKNTIKTLEKKSIDYEEKILQYQNEIFNTGQVNEVELARLTRIYEINEGFLTQLIEKKAQYSISQAGYVSQNLILQKSSPPTEPISPRKKMTLIIFLAAGILISLSIVILRYLLHSQITSITDITSYTDAPIIGTIPKYNKEIPVSQLIVNINCQSRISEAFRTLRTNLEFIAHGESNKIITVSSTVPGEGKTFVAINLAGILAISGKKVILIDLDLRKPRIHKGFDIVNDKGVSTILIKKHLYKDCIKKSRFENLEFITAGPIPPNPSELIISKEMDEFLSELHNEYDFIIIDTPPIGIVSDGISIFKKAAFPIYVTRANYSRRNYINNINHLIDDKNITKISVVLNGLDTRQTKYGYGYGYGYGGYGAYGEYGYGYFEEEFKPKLPWYKKIIKRILFFIK